MTLLMKVHKFLTLAFPFLMSFVALEWLIIGSFVPGKEAFAMNAWFPAIVGATYSIGNYLYRVLVRGE